MAKAQTLTGHRAKLLINGKAVGLFANCSWSIRQSKQPVYILGRSSPAEIVPTGQDPVQMRLTGLRVVDRGPYVIANATHLKDLLEEEDFSVDVIDRQTGKVIFRAVGCRVLGWASGVAAQGVSDVSIDIIGLLGSDESTIDEGGENERADAANLTDN